MLDTITIRKGLDIPISGAAERRVTDAREITTYAVKTTDYVGLTPRLLVEEGTVVSAGEVLFCDKNDERILFTSPVNGRVTSIVRGDKRKLLEVVVTAEGPSAPAVFEQPSSSEELKSLMLRCGLWTLLRQRPYGTVANPDDQPKAIFVSGFSSAPLAPDHDFMMQGRETFLKKGLEALTLLTEGTVHVCFKAGHHLAPQSSALFHDAKQRIQTHYVKGPHPAGNVGTQIAHIDPINKGEVVWTMPIQDVAVLGELVSTGIYNPEKLVAVAGPGIKNPHYYRVKAGACLKDITTAQLLNTDYPKMEAGDTLRENRIISGDILSGNQIAPDGFLGAYDDLVSILPEGYYYDFMGWLMPGFRKYSFSRTFLSGFLPKNTFKPMGLRIPRFSSFWRFDTNTHGDERPLVFTGNFERVFPFDIYPTQLIKACIVGDIELMENLGIYEVEPEDFALCEFIDTSKTNIQAIIREALETLRKEARG
ncbi:MAG: Na(+)-translocating NADH-quinone reductase subunit A [Bacteroidales bacterium]|nr:Na(+)-translocating NADH-quinone reductase subunit A [Bacteroidales bacterium]